MGRRVRCQHGVGRRRRPHRRRVDAGAFEVTGKHDAALVHRGRDLRSCPHVDAAYQSGALGTAKVRALLKARLVYPDLFTVHEAGLVDEVAPLTVAHANVAIAALGRVRPKPPARPKGASAATPTPTA